MHYLTMPHEKNIRVLVDGDIAIYRAAHKAADLDEARELFCEDIMQKRRPFDNRKNVEVYAFITPPGNSFRRTIYKEYKAQRKEKPAAAEFDDKAAADVAFDDIPF